MYLFIHSLVLFYVIYVFFCFVLVLSAFIDLVYSFAYFYIFLYDVIPLVT